MTIAIIGAGLAGLACATSLQAAGHTIALFDKGRGPGGRMSSRRVATPLGEASFDHGAQYFTARDPLFQAQVETWHNAGLAQPWPAAGPDAWVGTPTMNTPLKHLAAPLSKEWNTRIDRITGHPGHWTLHGENAPKLTFSTVLLAVPAENTAPLLATIAPHLSATAKSTPADPCWTVMAAFAERLPTPHDIFRQDAQAPPIGWAARNSAKPGRTGPEAWIIQAGPAWSQLHLEKPPETIVPLLLEALASRVGTPLPPILAASAHRWRYARSGAEGHGALWDEALRIGVCGDWLLGPRVECAWLSGRQLAKAASDRVS